MDTNRIRNKHYNIDQKGEENLEDQRRDGGTNFILRIKEQETRLTLHEYDDDDDYYYYYYSRHEMGILTHTILTDYFVHCWIRIFTLG